MATLIEQLADPAEPFLFSDLGRPLLGRSGGGIGGVLWKVALATVLLIVLTLVWYATPLGAWADPEPVRAWLTVAAQEPWAVVVVVGVFLAGGLVAFPVTILIAATAAAFGPWLGFLYAAIGVLTSALLVYGLGALYGHKALQSLMGPRLDRIRTRIAKQGVLAVAAVRVVPVAPFTFVNLALGASSIKLVDYLAGTLLGMVPGLIVMSMLGHRIVAIISEPSRSEVSLLALAVIGWIVVSFAVQAIVSRMGNRVS